MSQQTNERKARESFATIHSYYSNHRESLGSVPDWVDRPETGTILIGYRPETPPSHEQMTRARESLLSLLGQHDVEQNLSDSEKSLFRAAVGGSSGQAADRYSASSYDGTVHEALTADVRTLAQLSSSAHASKDLRDKNKAAKAAREQEQLPDNEIWGNLDEDSPEKKIERERAMAQLTSSASAVQILRRKNKAAKAAMEGERK